MKLRKLLAIVQWAGAAGALAASILLSFGDGSVGVRFVLAGVAAVAFLVGRAIWPSGWAYSAPVTDEQATRALPERLRGASLPPAEPPSGQRASQHAHA